MALYINQRYVEYCVKPGNINEHLPILKQFSTACETIIEMGVNTMVSTWAFLKGLSENGVTNKRLICVDINTPYNIDNVIESVKEVGINMEYINHNSATIDIPETDLLFIDTWHIYAHLKKELETHHSKVRKYIILHDTTIDRTVGESIRRRMDTKKQSEYYGYPEEEIRQGLGRAVSEFLINHSEWNVLVIYENNNGLTVLQRCHS